MQLGVVYWATDETVGPAEFATEVEARGFESMWLGDHTHVPVSRETPYPGSLKKNPGLDSLGLEAGDVPREYMRMLPPFMALAVAATVTSRIKLGTSICLVAQRDPILLAKEVAWLDQLSGGRFLFGVGFGWSREEMQAHGVDYDRRHAIVREKVAAMKALWTEERASFTGKHVDLQPTWMWPKPVQKPHPPVLIGADGPLGIKHTVEYGDGWIPVAGKVVEKMAMLQAAADEVGRDASQIEVTVTSPRPSLEGLAHYRDAGVHRVLLWLPPPAARDDVLRTLDEWAAYIPELVG